MSVCPVSSLCALHVPIRGGNIQQMESWYFRAKPPLSRGKRLYIEDGPHVEILNLISLKTASGSFRNCRCSMKLLRKGPATSSQLTRGRMLKFWISSPCARENRVFGFIAPRTLVNPWPVRTPPGMDVSSLTWERFVQKVPLRNFQFTAYRQSILHATKKIEEVWKKSCSEGLKVIEALTEDGLRFAHRKLSHLRC